MSIRVLLVEDHLFVREACRFLLEREPDIEVVGEAGEGREAIASARIARPDVILMDLELPGLGGLETIERLLTCPSPSRIVALSAATSSTIVRAALAAGATSFVTKSSTSAELVQAIRATHGGRRYLSSGITESGALDVARRGRSSIPLKLDLLTARERTAVLLFAEGMTTKQIAARMGLSDKTADKYRRNGMRKLHISTQGQLTRHAMAAGLLAL